MAAASSVGSKPRNYMEGAAPNPFFEPSQNSSEIADRVTELMRGVALGMNQEFRFTTYPEGATEPNIVTTTGLAMCAIEQVAASVIRADCTSGVLGKLLAQQAGEGEGRRYGSSGGGMVR